MEVIDIEAIQFLPQSDEFIEKVSCSLVTVPDTGSNFKQPESVANLFMGSCNDLTYCFTCRYEKSKCPGHPGHIKLHTYLYNPLLITEIVKYLRYICYKCGSLTESPNVTTSTLTQKLKKGQCICSTCGTVQSYVYENPKERGTLVVESYEYDKEKKETVKVDERKLLPNEVHDIFSRISPDSLEILGIHDPALHPANYLNKDFYVPPNSIRPNATGFNTTKIPKNDLNLQINNILKENQKGSETDPKSMANFVTKLLVMNSAFKRPQAVADKKNKNLVSTLTNKTGYIRGTVLGARTFCVARNFITGNPAVGLDEVRIPQFLAKQIQIEETVTRYNRESLQKYLNNGMDVYPRCVNIYKKKFKSYYVTAISKDQILEEGDRIYRDIIDGDIVGFCRQPTLMISNICGMKVQVSTESKTFEMNPNIVDNFGADFDGDEMNFYIVTDLASRYEAYKIMGFNETFVSNVYGKPIASQKQDGTLGLARLTRDSTRLDLKNACRLFNETGLTPDMRLTSQGRAYPEFYTGRDILTILFRDRQINIDYKTRAEYYKEAFAKYRSYSETEINVEIRGGVFVSGIIDKKTVGDKLYAGLYHIIYQKYGPRTAISCMWYMQRIAINFNNLIGTTMTIRDFLIEEEQLANIRKIEQRKIAESQLLTENLHRGKVYAPSGKTVEEFYESQQMEILSSNETYSEFVHRGLDYENNNLYFAIHTGTKGSSQNLLSTCVAYGSASIDGGRLKKKLAGRSSIFFPRDSPDPAARGYVSASFASGFTVSDTDSASYTERRGLIDKSLSTARTGAKYRETNSSLDSVILNNFRQVVKGSRIRQLLYCGDGVDPRAAVRAVSSLIHKSESEIDVTGAEKTQLLSDRDFMRRVFFDHHVRTGETVGSIGFVPVNVRLICREVRDKPFAVRKFDKLEFMTRYIANIPKLYLNENYKGVIPKYLQDSCRFFQAYLRYKFRSTKLTKYSEAQLETITTLINQNFINNLENPGTCVGIRASQAISEPNTQQMLKSIHVKHSNKLVYFESIVTAMSPERDTNAFMKIYLRPDIDVREFAKKIEMVKFREFVNNYKIFYEYFGKTTHPHYIKENEIIKKKLQFFPQPPSDLLPWCIRLEFNIDALINKNITTEEIYYTLEKNFPFLYIVFETINVGNMMRIYFRQTATASYSLSNSMYVAEFVDHLLDFIVRGVDGIRTTYVFSRTLPKLVADKIESVKCEYIQTDGSNLGAILLMDEVDTRLTISSNPVEMSRYFGITAARNFIVDCLRDTVAGSYLGHYTIFADEMCSEGIITGLNNHGSAKRGTSICQLIADSSPIRWVRLAVSKGIKDYHIGPNSALIQGTNAKVGTNYNTVILNEGFYNSEVEIQLREIEDI